MNNLMKTMNIPEGSNKLVGGGKAEESRVKDSNKKNNEEHNTSFYYEVYHKLKIYYEYSINEEERKNKCFLKNKNPLSEVTKLQDELVTFFDKNIELFSNPFHFLNYEEDNNINKNDLKNYLGTKYPNLLSLMEDIIKCSLIINRNVYYVCDLFNEVYKKIEKNNIHTEISKTIYINEVLKECIEKENLIIMIFLEILRYINRNEKIGITLDGDKKSMKHEYFSEKEDNYTDSELKKNEEVKSSSDNSSLTNNSLASLNISKKKKKKNINNKKINGDKFSYYILVNLTENDFVENLFLEIDKIIKFLIKFDGICDKTEYVFNYKTHKINILFNLLDLLFLYFSKFHANINNISAIFKSINHLVSTKYFDFISTDYYVKELDNLLFLESQKKNKKIIKYMRNIKNNKLISQVDDYYKLDINISDSALNKLDDFSENGLNPSVSKPLNFEASTSLSKINQPLTSGITNTQEQNVNTSTGIGNTSNVPNIVVTGSNENVANINQRTQNPLDVNSLNRFGSNVLSNDQINSSTFHPEVNNLGGRNTGNMINSQNKYGIKNNIFNKCLDCTGYWYSCNCSLNNFEKSTLTLSTQISLLLILCLHPNIDKYVYEKRKNIKINNSLSPDGTNIGVQSSGKEHINDLLELKKKKIDFDNFHTPIIWKYNCMSTEKDYKHLMGIKNNYMISENYITENISYYYSFFSKISEAKKKKKYNKIEEKPVEEFWNDKTLQDASNNGITGSSSTSDSNILMLKFVIGLFINSKEDIFSSIFDDNIFKLLYNFILKKISSYTLIGNLIFHLFHSIFLSSFIKNGRTTDLWNTFIDSHIKRDFNLRRKKKIDSKDTNMSKDPLTSSSINKTSYIQDDMVIRPNFDGIPRNITQHRMGSDSLLNRTIQNPSDLYMHQNSYRSIHNNIIYIYKKKGECIIDILIFLKILCTNYPRLITKYVCILKNIINRYHSRIMEFSEIDDTFYHHNLEQIHEVDNSGNRSGSSVVPNRGLKNEHEKYSQLKEKKYYNINEERRMIIMKYRSLKLIAEEKMKICIDFYSDIFVQILDFASVLCNNIYDLKIIENVVMCFKTPLTANLNIFNLIKKLFNQFTCALNGKFNEFSKITNKQHIYEKTRGNTKSGLVLNNNFNIIDDEATNGFIDSINIDATNSGQISGKNSRDLYRNVFGRGANLSNTQNVTTGSNNNASLFSPYKDANGKNGNGDEEYEDGNDYRYDDDDDYCSNAYFTYINYFKLNLLEKLFEQNNYLKEILKNNNVMEYLEKNNAYLRNLIKENYLVEKHINDKKIFKNYASNLDAYNKLLSYENDYTASARDANKILQDIEQSNNKLKLFLDFKGVTSLFGVQINPISDVGGLQNNLDPNTLALQGSMSNFLENLLEEKNCINYLLADNKVADNLLRENNILKYEYNKYNMIDLFFKNKMEESQLDNIKSIMLTEYSVNKILSHEKRFKILKTNFDGSYNNKEAIKIFFEDNKEAINFFKDKKYEPPIFKDDDSSSLNENIMNRAKVILKRELEDDSKSYIDARYLLNNIFEKRFYPYNCIKMLEKCLLFLSSVNNNKLCYYMPLNKNLLVDYILLEQYESTSGNTAGGGPIDIANMHLQENNNMNKLFPDEDEKNPFRIRNKKYNNMISLIDTQNYINTTQFKNVFIHNLNMHSNKISQDKHKIVKHYKTLHLLDMLYEIVKTKGNSSLDLLNLKCLSLEILCSSFVKNSSSALSVLCTITNIFPDIFLDVVKQFKEQNDNLKKKLDFLDKEATIENSKYKKVDQLTTNLSVPNINLKVIIIFMKCVNFLLYMIGIKRKFNMSLTKIWYFFNNIEKIEEIDLKMKSKRSANPNSNSKTKNSEFFDIFYNFDDFFDEIDNEQNSEDAEHDQDGNSNGRAFNISNLDGSHDIGSGIIGNKSGVEKERKKNTKNIKNNLEQGMNNNSTIGGSSNEINANDFEDGENNDIYEKCLKKKLMIGDDDKNVCKHLIILTNYIVQNIFYNLINNFILKKIRDQKYEAEDFLDENIKLEIFMNKQENSMFKRRYNYYINKSKNIESQIITMQNDVNTNTSNIYQIEQVLRQNNVTFEPYINSQKMFDKAFSSNLGGNLSTSIPTNSLNPFSSNLGIGASTSQLGTTSLGLGTSNTMSLFKQDNKGTNFSSMFNSGNTQTNALGGASALNTSSFNTSSNFLNPSQANTPAHSIMDSQRTMFASTSRLISPSQETLGLNSASSNTIRDPSNASLFNTATSSNNNLFKPQTGLNMFSSNNSGPNNSNLFSTNQSNTTGLFGGSNVGNTGLGNTGLGNTSSNINDSRGSGLFGSNMQANKTNPSSSSFGSMFNQTAGTSNTGGNSLGLGSGFGLGSRPGMNTSNNLMLNNMDSKNTQLGTTLGASTSTSLFGANRSTSTLTNNNVFSSTTNTNSLLNPSQNNSGSNLFNKSPLGASNTMSNNSNLFSSTTGSTSLFGSNTTPQTSTFGNATNSMTQTTSSSLFNNTFGAQQNNAASNNNLLGLSSTGQGMNQQSSLFSNNSMGFSNNLMGNRGNNSYLFGNQTNQNLMNNNTSLFSTGNIYSHLGNEQNNLQNILSREGIQNVTQLKEYYEELKIKTNVLNAEIYKSKMELKKNEYNLQKEKKIQLIKEKKLRYMKSKSDINFKEKEMYILIILVFMYFKLILKGPLPSTKNNKKLNTVMNERFDYLCDFRPTMYLFEQILGESNRFMNTFFNVIFLDNILHEENKNLEKIISKYKNDSDYITIYNKKKTLFRKNIGTEDEIDTSEQFSDLKNVENNLFTTLTPEAYYKKKMEYITCSYSKENYNNLLFHKIKSLGLSILKILFERDVLFIHMYNQWKNEKILYEKINKFHLNFNTINNNGTNKMTNSNVNDSTSGSLLNNNNFNMLTANLNDANSRGNEQIREGIEAGTSTGADGKEINFTESLCTPICVHNFLFKNININSSTTYLILLLKNFFRSSEINKIIIYFILQIIIRDTKTTINILKRDADSFNYLKYALKNLFIYNLNQQKFNNSYIISNREIKMQNILNNFIDIPLMYYLKKKNNMKTKYSMANTRKNRELYDRSKKNSVSGNEVLNTSNWLSYINKHNGGNNEVDDIDMDYQVEKNKLETGDPNLGLKTKEQGSYLFDEAEEGNYLKYMDDDSTNSSYSSYNSETSDSEYKKINNFENGGHTGLNDSYGLRNEMVLKYKNFKLKNSKRNKSKYVYDYLSDSDLIDTIKSKKICIFYDNKEKDEENDNITFYNISSENINDNYSKNDYYNEIKSVNYNITGFCSSYNFLPINNFYTEKYDFIENELVYMSDLKLYFYIKSFKRHSYFTKLLNIEKVSPTSENDKYKTNTTESRDINDDSNYGNTKNNSSPSNLRRNNFDYFSATPNKKIIINENDNNIMRGKNIENKDLKFPGNNKAESDDEQNDIEKIVEEEIKVFDFYNKLNKLNENMLFPNIFYDSRGDKMKYIEYIKKVAEREQKENDGQYKNILGPINNILKTQKNEIEKQLSIELRKKYIYINNEYCEWIELSHLLNVDIDYNDIRGGLNKNNSVLNNYSRMPITKLILYFYEIITRKFLFLNNSDSLIENCVLSLLGLSFIPSKQMDRKNLITSIDESLELEENSFLNSLIKSVIVNFSNYEHISETIKVGYNNNIVEMPEQNKERKKRLLSNEESNRFDFDDDLLINGEDEEDSVQGNYANKIDNENNFFNNEDIYKMGSGLSNDSSKIVLLNKKRKDYYKKNIFLNNSNNLKQYNTFEKNIYFIKSLNIIYMMSKNKKIKEYIINLINTMWYNKYNVFYYITQNVNIDKLKDTEKIIFFKVSLHILNIFIPILDHILNNIDKHVGKFINLSFPNDKEDNNSVEVFESADNNATNESANKNNNAGPQKYCNIFHIINKENFNQRKNLFEFLNPIFTFDNVQNFINHYINIVKNYNDNYLKHYIYHYYLFNYDFEFQRIYNYSNLEHIHYIKSNKASNEINEKCFDTKGGINEYNKKNVHLLYTNIINVYVNFCKILNSYKVNENANVNFTFNNTNYIGNDINGDESCNIVDDLKNKILKPMHMENETGFNFEDLNEIIGNKSYLLKFLDNYYLNGEASKETKKEHLEKNVYIYNSINYLNINYKNWLLVYKTYIEKITYLVDLILKIKNNTIKKKIYYLKNYFYIVNNIQRHLKNVTSLIKSSHYINFNIQITPILFIVYLFITIFFLSHNNKFAFRYLSCINKGFHNLFKGKNMLDFKNAQNVDEDEEEDEEENAKNSNDTSSGAIKQNKKIKFYDEINGSKKDGKESDAHLYDNDEFKIDHLKYNKKLKMSSVFSKQILTREFQNNIINIPKTYNQDGNTNLINNFDKKTGFGYNNGDSYMHGNGIETILNLQKGELYKSGFFINNGYNNHVGSKSSSEDKLYYDIHSEYYKLILKSNEFFGDLLQLLIILITKKHPVLNKYTIIYIYECLYTLLNIYHYSYTYAEKEYNAKNNKNMFISLIKRIDQNILNEFISTLFTDSYKNFFTNTNSTIPIYFYNNIYKFIDYNTEIFMMKNNEELTDGASILEPKNRMTMNNFIDSDDSDIGNYFMNKEQKHMKQKKKVHFADSEPTKIINANKADVNINGENTGLINLNFKNNFENKIHLNSRSLNLYEEIYCSNFLYNKNDLNLLSINLLIFLLTRIGIYEIDIKIDENNVKNLIKGNLFIFNKNAENENENKILHTCFLLSALCDTSYINEFVSNEDLFSLFLKSNIFNNLYEYKFNYLSNSISFLTFPTNFLENKNIYIPLPMLIISYITVILKVVDKKGLQLFNIIGKWITKNISIFTNHLIVNNYLMKSHEIAHEINNFTTYNHNLVYKCLCYASTCNFTKEPSSGTTNSPTRPLNFSQASTNVRSSKETDSNASKRNTENLINHANVKLVNLDIIYSSTYYLLRLYKNYLLYIHQNYLSLKKLKIVEEINKRKKNKSKKIKQNLTYMEDEMINKKGNIGGIDSSKNISSNEFSDEHGMNNGVPMQKQNYPGNNYDTNYSEYESDENSDFSEDEDSESQDDDDNIRGTDSIKSNFSKLINSVYNNKNSQFIIGNYNDPNVFSNNNMNTILGNTSSSGFIENNYFYIDKGLSFEFNEISLNICNIIKEHTYILQYVKDLLNILSIFVIYDISLRDENELVTTDIDSHKESRGDNYLNAKGDNNVDESNYNYDTREMRRKNIRTHRILQNIIPKYSIKFHCINLCLDIIEYDIGIYDEYVQQYKTKYYEYIKIVLKVFMNTSFYYINIIKYENKHMLKSVSMAMKKLTNIIFFLLTNLTRKEKTTDEDKKKHALLNKFLYDKSGYKKNAHEITTELFNCEDNIFTDKKCSLDNIKKFLENTEIDIHVLKKILTCIIYFTFAMLNNQKVNKINIENINLNHINKINLKKIANTYLENNNILKVFTFILQRSTQIYYLLYNYAMQS